jgi:hypothetical protein
MPIQVSYDTIGNLKNNMFQYIAAKIIAKIYNVEIVRSNQRYKDCYQIYATEWKELCEYYIDTKDAKVIPKCCTLYLHGYFESSNISKNIFFHFRDYLKEIITSDNHDYINDEVRVCDICSY